MTNLRTLCDKLRGRACRSSATRLHTSPQSAVGKRQRNVGISFERALLLLVALKPGARVHLGRPMEACLVESREVGVVEVKLLPLHNHHNHRLGLRVLEEVCNSGAGDDPA